MIRMEDDFMYIITKWWTNGESYEDWHEYEYPVAVYDSLDKLKEFLKSNDFTDLRKVNSRFANYSYTFEEIEEPIEEFKCPFGVDFYECEYQCWGSSDSYDNWIESDCRDEEPDVYKECYNFRSGELDNSGIEYRVYKIDNINGGIDND